MKEIKIWVALELRGLYGINKFLHTKNKKEKNRYLLLGSVWAMLIVMVFGYVAALVYGLSMIGLHQVVPMYLVSIASVLVLVFGIFKAGNVIFSQKSYDIISSMPVKQSTIVISRFFAMYVEDLVLTFVIMLPGIVTYGICQKPGVEFYLASVTGALFVPAIPLVISLLFGTFVMAVSSRMKHKNMAQIAFSLLVVIGTLLLSFNVQGLEEELDVEKIVALVGSIKLPQITFGTVALYVIASVGVMVLAITLVSANFHSIMRRLQTFSAKHRYQITEMESRSMLKALYVRELKRYFSSSIYVTNTIVGPIMGAMMSVAICVMGLEVIESSIPVPIDVSGILPFAVAAVFCMMTTTSVSISMEGKQFWVIQSLPISAKTLFDSKILMNLSIMLPFYLVSVVCLAIATRASLLGLIWIVLVPLVLMLFSTVIGITINLKLHSFDWEKEEYVVKQSAGAMLGGFAGALTGIVMTGIVFVIPMQFAEVTKAVICVVLLAGTAFFYGKNNQAKLNAL